MKLKSLAAAFLCSSGLLLGGIEVKSESIPNYDVYQAAQGADDKTILYGVNSITGARTKLKEFDGHYASHAWNYTNVKTDEIYLFDTRGGEGGVAYNIKTGEVRDLPASLRPNDANIAIMQKDLYTSDIETNASNIETNEKNINDLGYGVAGATALTAALSSLPVAPDDSPLSCGLGTGGYSSRFAMSIGCAAQLNDRLSVNVGGSHVFGGSSDYGGGSLDTVAARGGFMFKFGTIQKPTTSNEEQLQSQLDEVKKENKELLARIERLEAIALGVGSHSDMSLR